MDYYHLDDIYWATYSPASSGASSPDIGEIYDGPSPRYDPMARYNRGGLGSLYAGTGTLGMGYHMYDSGVQDRWGGRLYGGSLGYWNAPSRRY